MGFFDFVRDAGRQIFDTDAEAADNIKQHLEIKTSGIRNIDVGYDDGVATICGDCVYGKASAYTRIFEANKDVIENPDRIFPGQKIRIPLD